MILIDEYKLSELFNSFSLDQSKKSMLLLLFMFIFCISVIISLLESSFNLGLSILFITFKSSSIL